ncbi:unnamed protein product [Toxocara canis]|uniref:Secreted protein n=1 Tax=Toxocara canis TaxID=6265 RepID=A0A183VFV4_TOXCA|nr:unnamed protein product [Toxocara canis]
MRAVPVATQFVRLSIWALCSICMSVAAPGLPPSNLKLNVNEGVSFDSFSEGMVESSINNTLLDFGVTAINGITFWRNLLAVLTPNAIVLFEFASETLDPGKSSHEVGRIYLSTSVDLDLLEFKFFNQSSVFFCDPFTCRFVERNSKF